MAKILFLCCLVLLSWTLQQVFLEGLSPVGQRRQSRVPRQVRPSEYKRKEQARRQQGQHKPRKPITTFGDGLNQMHQASLKGNVPTAVDIFEELSANSEFVVETSTINTIIQAAANIGNVDSAEKWFKKIPEYGLNATVESYTGLISAYTKKRKVAKAEKVFKDMQAQEIEPDSVAYGALLSAFAGVGDLRSAEQYFRTMESARLKPNEIVYGAMVKAAGTSKGGYLAAERWLQRMEDANLKPGKIEYTELINCAGKARDLKAAEAVFAKMGAAHVMPDAITYTAMINAAAQTKGPECAASKFGEMLMLNLKPTVVTYNTLMRAWFQARKYQEVLETFKQMKAAGKADGFAPNVVAYTAVIKSLSRLGRVQEIEPTLAEMLGGKVKADDYCRQALKDALGTEEYTRISKKLGLDRYGVATTADKIDTRIEQTQRAKLDNMRREQNKALLRNRP